MMLRINLFCKPLVHSFLLPSSILLWILHIVHLAKDMWIVFFFWLWMKLLRLLYKCLCGLGFHFLWVKKWVEWWWDHLCSLFKMLLKVIQGQIITWGACFVVLLLNGGGGEAVFLQGETFFLFHLLFYSNTLSYHFYCALSCRLQDICLISV